MGCDQASVDDVPRTGSSTASVQMDVIVREAIKHLFVRNTW
jgi:hypothetical protein